MSFSAHKALEESAERQEHASHGETLFAISAAVIAVLAALATMLAGHYSVGALSTKNEAILQMSRAADAYSYYESKRIKYHIYSALVAADVAKDAKGTAQLKAVAATEEKEAVPVLKQAQKLEEESNRNQDDAERRLTTYEMLEVTTTLFEVAIVFVSISALTRTRFLLYMSGALCTGGIGYGLFALLHGA